MYPDQDFDPKAALPANATALTQDLELDTVFDAMAAGDPVLLEAAKRAVPFSLDDPALIRYRQQILTDCCDQPNTVRHVYNIAVAAVEGERKIWGWLRKTPDSALHRGLEMMRLFVPLLRQLRKISETQGPRFRSPGFATLWAMLSKELSGEYLQHVEDHLQRLTFPEGVVISASLGPGNRGLHYVLREPPPVRTWWERVRDWKDSWGQRAPETYIYEVAERDEAGHQALRDLWNQGISRVAGALGRSADHVLSFFVMLRWELAFYVGCMNLRERLGSLGHRTCIPEPLELERSNFDARGLCDIALALKLGTETVANDVAADGKSLIMITGANRGGKSTLLRAFGQAQLMMQCGLFVTATSFRANVCRGVFTHYKREEDPTMRSGKLDEELKRMSSIVDLLERRSLVLCNESFGSTNEREGSEIARQIVRALLEQGVKVFFVTHLFDLAHGFYSRELSEALFLRAERLSDGRRTFRVMPGEPLPTSYGPDLYRKLFDVTGSEEKGPEEQQRQDPTSGTPGPIREVRKESERAV